MMDSVELDWLEKWKTYSPDQVAIMDVESDYSYTYGEFFNISNGLVPYLRGLGVERGDRVAVLANNRVETVFLFFALQRIGAILVPINFRWTTPEVDYVLKDSGAKLLFYDVEFLLVTQGLQSAVQRVDTLKLQKASEEARSCSDHYVIEGHFTDPCKILYTSGTTGFPKGVVVTHKILFWNSINTSLSLNLSSSDCMVSFLPLFHVGGWNVLLTPFIHRGAKTIFLKKFDGPKILQLCETEKVSVLFGVPTTLGMMAKSPEFSKIDLSSVRFAIVGGEPMPLKLIQTWHNKGVAVRQGFGLTECGPNCFSLNEEDAEKQIGSIGRPNFYVETRVIDEENQDVPVDKVGELLLRGPMCMTEYWQNSEATREAFYDGWLRTGDLVRKDKDNYFFVVGRKKEMFISGGENVYPAEVEKIIGMHPDIDEVAVLGAKDPQWGEVGRAFVVKRKDSIVKSSDILKFCQSNLAKFKIPKSFEFISELPKGSTGKILKRKLIAPAVVSDPGRARVDV